MHSNRTQLIRAGLLLTSAMIGGQALSTTALQAQDKTVPKKEAAAPVAPLMLTATTDQPTYKVGSAVKLTLSAKNTTPLDIPLRFNSGQRYDFELFRGKDAKGEKVWQWSKGRMFGMMLSSTLLKPAKPLEYTETYHPGGDGMPALAPGFYTVVATLKGASKTTTPPISLPSAATTFQIN